MAGEPSGPVPASALPDQTGWAPSPQPIGYETDDSFFCRKPENHAPSLTLTTVADLGGILIAYPNCTADWPSTHLGSKTTHPYTRFVLPICNCYTHLTDNPSFYACLQKLSCDFPFCGASVLVVSIHLGRGKMTAGSRFVLRSSGGWNGSRSGKERSWRAKIVGRYDHGMNRRRSRWRSHGDCDTVELNCKSPRRPPHPACGQTHLPISSLQRPYPPTCV